ncbi:MAG: GTP-binding protein, partial [Sphingomonas sp.]
MAERLHLLTCGSVDDGKSTLIGRLLVGCGAVPEDRVAGIEDFAFIADGLEAEREQGITIDVARLAFATANRRFLLADAPGHEQYTRNMATGASTADLAIVLVDARKGLTTQTRRHVMIARLLGVRAFVLAVNKMDLVGWQAGPFNNACYALGCLFAEGDEIEAIPVSALEGDNVLQRSERMGWYDGPTLIEYLDRAAPRARTDIADFRMPVQMITRDGETRFLAGTVASGSIRPGEAVTVAGGASSKVARIAAMDGDRDGAQAGDAVSLVLADPVDCGRGDTLFAGTPPMIADQFEASLIWLDEEKLLPGRRYLLKHGARTVAATVQSLKHQIDVETMAPLAARTLALNEIGIANLWTVRPLAFEPYAQSRELGGFILIDPVSARTIAAGLIHFGLRRADNLHEQASAVTPARRAALMGQRPKLLWFTGLSGAGKSTIADLVEQKLHEAGRHTFLLDGDNVRLGLNRDLGFTAADRVENIRRVGETAKLMLDAG